MYLCLCIFTCIFVFVLHTLRNLEVLVPLPSKKYSTCHVYLQLWPMLYLHICVFVFVYLQVRHQGPLFLRSSYRYLFKNIVHAMSICNFDQYCICVFVYLCIYICVFESQTARNIVSEALLPLPFQKYSKCNVYLQLWPMLYLRICVFVYLQVRHLGTLFLKSWYHYLSWNIWFV